MPTDISTDISTTERSRRGLLAGAAVAAAAAVAASVTRVVPTRAADGDDAVLGVINDSESSTVFRTQDTWALQGLSTNGRGVNGESTAGQGVHGESELSAGVAGKSTEGNGVHGTSRDNRGVWGESSNGAGVDGVSTTGAGVKAHGATGVLASSTEGRAIHTTAGRVRFDGISGVATIPEGGTQVEVETSVPLGQHTFVLLSPRTNLNGRDLWYQIPADTGKVTIRISSARNHSTPVAYLILEHAPQS
jgi:hypothetical protein